MRAPIPALVAAVALALAVACAAAAPTTPTPDDAETLERVRAAYTTPTLPSTPAMTVVATDLEEFERRLAKANSTIDRNLEAASAIMSACRVAQDRWSVSFSLSELETDRDRIPHQLEFQPRDDGTPRNSWEQTREEAMAHILRDFESMATSSQEALTRMSRYANEACPDDSSG